MVGIVQEQHAARARLFMQWKKMDWPVMVDSLNLLGVPVVPITVFIDEAGIVRRIGPNPDDVEAFLAAPAEASDGKTSDDVDGEAPPDLAALRTRAADASADAGDALACADAMVLWGDAPQMDAAIDRYYPAALEAYEGVASFRRGVAYRMRAERPGARPGDFAAAIAHWRRALALDPNQYIWRRRIQQYGPRLDKPYPFYDWVTLARVEIMARGETPVALPVEPSGAEIAHPVRSFVDAAPAESPDPDARVERDDGSFVSVETVVVPGTGKGSQGVRVHVTFQPHATSGAHWNNEAEDLGVWIDPPEGWSIDRRWHTLARPPAAVSDEVRTIEFELAPPAGATDGRVTIPAYALYYVCRGNDGACLYRRRDLAIDVTSTGR